MAIKVKALKAGTIGKGKDNHRVYPGDVFVLPDGQKPGSWMEVLSQPEVAEKPRKARVQKTEAEPVVEVAE